MTIFLWDASENYLDRGLTAGHLIGRHRVHGGHISYRPLVRVHDIDFEIVGDREAVADSDTEADSEVTCS